MESEFERVERLRGQYAATLLELGGVASVTVGVCAGGKPCLKIGTLVPVDQVRDRLPAELAEVEVELFYQGDLTPAAAAPQLSPEYQDLERLRAKIEADLMKVEGVVMVATGICGDGKPCLKVGTSVPVEQVRPNLPQELAEARVELEYVGEIRIH